LPGCPPRPRQLWRVRPARDTDTVIIGDSNWRQVKWAPKSWEVHALSGGRMADAVQLVKAFEEDVSLRHLIVQLGINHRNESFPAEALLELREVTEKKGIRLLLMGISVSEQMPDRMIAKLESFNNDMHRIMGLWYLHPLRMHQVAMDRSEESMVHYDFTTVQRLVNHVIERMLATRILTRDPRKETEPSGEGRPAQSSSSHGVSRDDERNLTPRHGP